jgi:hypothetical protein
MEMLRMEKSLMERCCVKKDSIGNPSSSLLMLSLIAISYRLATLTHL